MYLILRNFVGKNGDLALVAAMVGILVVLFSPIPPRLLDVLIITNVSFGLLLLLLTFFMEKPVEFSTFPSLLLIATLFRLALNVAATRLIFHDADAGRVIAAVGSHVVGGNYIIGLVVFVILVVVQYVVVTSGAQRVAEVAARFTLDSIPGQQMSIDADLNMGFIDQAEAQRRRKNLEKEANFYGAMDGASKFVKGDAIAGIVILLIDIVGGLAVGVAQRGMSWSDALHTYTLLTIGDGIVTQVPALVIAVGTGIIVTRSGSDERLSSELTRQITSFPKAFGFVAAALLGLAFLPGIPVLPTMVLFMAVGAVGLLAGRHANSKQAAVDTVAAEVAETSAAEFSDLLQIDPVQIRVGRSLVALFNDRNPTLQERILTFRKQFASDLGFVIPQIRMADDSRVASGQYQICFYGVLIAQGELMADRILAIHPAADRRKLQGVETRDPTYGLPAVWIEADQKDAARGLGYTLVDVETVFVTHLTETLRRNASQLLTRAETDRWLARLRQVQPGLIEDLVPNVLAIADIQRVLQNLLREGVPIRNAELIVEELADRGRHSKDVEVLTEAVRLRLGAVICQSLMAGAAELQVLTLDPAIETTMATSLRAIPERPSLVLEPRFAEQLISRTASQVEAMIKRNVMPVLLCAPELRRHLRQFTERVIPHLNVISLTEIPNNVALRSFGVVTM